MFLIARAQTYGDDVQTRTWNAALAEAYGEISTDNNIIVSQFEPVFSLFLLVRQIERDSRIHPGSNDSTLKFFQLS